MMLERDKRFGFPGEESAIAKGALQTQPGFKPS
jgi:hypothetical protein